jgi:hypothetical protein
VTPYCREVISLDGLREERDVNSANDQAEVVAAVYDRAKVLLRPVVWNATNRLWFAKALQCCTRIQSQGGVGGTGREFGQKFLRF